MEKEDVGGNGFEKGGKEGGRRNGEGGRDLPRLDARRGGPRDV